MDLPNVWHFNFLNYMHNMAGQAEQAAQVAATLASGFQLAQGFYQQARSQEYVHCYLMQVWPMNEGMV